MSPFAAKTMEQLSKEDPAAANKQVDLLDSFQWFELIGEVTFPDAVIGENQGRKYILLATRPPCVMLPGEGKDAWGLTKVYTTKDYDGRPAISFELDEHGAELFTALTKENIHNALAIVVDGKVASAPVIQTVLGKHGIITGRFTEQEVNALVKALKTGMPPAIHPATAATSAPATQPAVGTRPSLPTLL